MSQSNSHADSGIPKGCKAGERTVTVERSYRYDQRHIVVETERAEYVTTLRDGTDQWGRDCTIPSESSIQTFSGRHESQLPFEQLPESVKQATLEWLK